MSLNKVPTISGADLSGTRGDRWTMAEHYNTDLKEGLIHAREPKDLDIPLFNVPDRK